MTATMRKLVKAEIEGKQTQLNSLMEKISKKSASEGDITKAKELVKEVEKLKRSLKTKED